jgi:phage-related minor tail protein
MAFQNSLIGMDETRASRATKLFELESGYLQQMRTIQEKFNEMKAAAAVGTDEERLAFAAFSKIYEAGMAKITSEYKGQVSEVNALVNQEEVLLAKEKNRQIIIDGITQQMERQATLGDQIRSAYDKLKDVQFEGAQMQRNPMEKQFAQIREDARKAAREASLAFAAGFEGMDLSIQQANELANGLEKIAQSYGKIAEAQMENIKQSRTFDQGWKEAFNSYIDESSNAANRGREAFSAFGSNINSAIDNFVTTGKFKFSDFARSIIQDLLKIELKAQASKLFSGMISTAGGFLSSLLGFAEGGQPPVGKPSIVGEKGPELFVPKTAGTIVPNGGSVGNAAQGNTYITNNISAIDAKSVAQLFAENRKTLFGSVQMAQKEMSYGR